MTREEAEKIDLGHRGMIKRFGEPLEVANVILMAASDEASSSSSRQDQASAFPFGPAILAGTGAVVGIAGYVVRASGQSDYDAANRDCSGGRCPEQSLVDAGNSGRSSVGRGGGSRR